MDSSFTIIGSNFSSQERLELEHGLRLHDEEQVIALHECNFDFEQGKTCNEITEF
ncbi:hypothetical protein N9D09_00945 [bacterium]|nr:hypothetical protein [bacterium]